MNSWPRLAVGLNEVLEERPQLKELNEIDKWER
jgi:hypothetical protein